MEGIVCRHNLTIVGNMVAVSDSETLKFLA